MDREDHGTHVSVRDTAGGCLQVPGWTPPQFPCLTALGRTICFSFSACLDFLLISHSQPCPPPFSRAAGPTVQRHELADCRRAAATILHELHLGHDDVVLEHRAAARAHCIAARRVKLDIRAAAAAAYAARHGGAAGPYRPPAAPLSALRPRPLAHKPRRTASVSRTLARSPAPPPPIRRGRFATRVPAARPPTAEPRDQERNSKRVGTVGPNRQPHGPPEGKVQVRNLYRPRGPPTSRGDLRFGEEGGMESISAAQDQTRAVGGA